MAQDFVTCKECGKATPNTTYCIFCGASIQKAREAAAPTYQPRPQYTPPAEVSTPDFEVDGLLRQEGSYDRFVLAQTREPYSDSELTQRLDELRRYWVMQIKLCELLVRGDVTGRVFTKVYDEYGVEIERIGKDAGRRIGEIRKRYEERTQEMNHLKDEYEELRVRVAVGERSEKELLTRSPGLLERINALTDENTRLERRLAELDEAQGSMNPDEVANVGRKIKHCLRSVDGLVEEGRISERRAATLRSDLRNALTFFGVDVESRRKEQEALMEELEALEVRFKVGEFSLAEYEGLKMEINEKLGNL